MKKLLAIALAAAIMLAMATSALAMTGFPAGTDAKTYKNFKVEIKAYEGRESTEGLNLGSFLSGGAAKEITGRVVIGTSVVVQVKVTIPKQANTDLMAKDYTSAKLNLTFGNLDVTGTPGWNNYYTGSDFLCYIPGSTPTALGTATSTSVPYYKANDTDEDYDVMLPDVSAENGNTYTFVVCGQAKKTAVCPVTATFTMGQDCSVSPYYVEYEKGGDTFHAGFTSDLSTYNGTRGSYFKVSRAGDNDYLAFDVNSSNKLSNLRFFSDVDGTGRTYALAICGVRGELLFNADGVSYHGCDEAQAVLYGNLKASYNKLLSSLGFDYNLGAADFGWATVKDVNSLANQVKVAAGYTFNECTEPLPGLPPVITIPQTGSFAYGFAVVALAIVMGAAVALRKLRA